MNSYPALYEFTTKTHHSLADTDSFIVGRSQDANLPVLDVTCSRKHFRLVRQAGHFIVEPLSTTSPTYCNNQPVVNRAVLVHGTVLRAGSCQFRFLEWAEDGGSLDDAAARMARERTQSNNNSGLSDLRQAVPAPQMTVMAQSSDQFVQAAELKGAIHLRGQMLIGREGGRVQIHLPHVHVSRIHAQIILQGHQRAVVTDLNSANGTFVNGTRLRAPMTIKAGDRLDIGPYSLVFTGAELIPQTREDNVELIGRNLTRIVQDRTSGKPLALLDHINLVIKPREFVCLLGPSGSGKTTLLSALSARAPADEGMVLVNGKDLYTNFEALKQDLALVPQKDVLHDSLSVEQALWYTARLRLPPDTSWEEIQECIEQMLSTVNLIKQRGTQIRYLSGGQVKRASLANEILCKPSLLFLDEVTSGLDEQTDREMMNLFRELADVGKTVVCITHSLANVERTCHLVVVLTPGGKLAFVGTPPEALSYFGIDRLGDVYEKIGERAAEEWQKQFAASPFYTRYIESRLPREADSQPQPVFHHSHSAADRLRDTIRQTGLLTRRYLAIQLGDTRNLLGMIGQSLLVALLLVLVYGDLEKVDSVFERSTRGAMLLFLMTVSCFWFGCNSAAKEIVKERLIYTRERDFNLLAGSYYASKFLLLAVFGFLQTSLLYLIVRTCCHSPGNFVAVWGLLLLVAQAGVAVGLAISAFSSTEDMAVTLTPIVLIPQIILSNALVTLKGAGQLMAKTIVAVYWGYRGLLNVLPEKDVQGVTVDEITPAVPFLVLGLHVIGFMMLALVLLMVQDRRKSRWGRSLFKKMLTRSNHPLVKR